MRASDRNPVHRVRDYLLAHDPEAASDSELLTRFVSTRDEAAFTILLRRHASLVLGTARRVLPNAADADDVFQAVFVTLARKAATLRCDGTLAPWLYRVTFRLAVRLRKRARALPPAAGRPAVSDADPLAQMSGRELCSVIDAEVSRLSAGLRSPIVLCCLQGLTRDEAAARLGWSVPTLKRRLARAREILERRLSARGIALPAALAPAVLSATWPSPASAEVVSAVVSAALGRTELPARIGTLCAGSSTALKPWAAFGVAGWVVAVGLFLALQPAGTSPAPAPPSSPPKVTDRLAEGVDVFGDPLPAGAVVRIGTTRFRHDEWLSQAVWSPDGRYIASSAGKTVIVWDAASGREVRRVTLDDSKFPLPAGQKQEFGSWVEGLEWSPDGKSLLTVFNSSVQHWAWDGMKKTLEFVQAYQNSDGRLPIVAARFAGAGSRALIAAPSWIQVTDLTKKSPVVQISTQPGTIARAVVAPDGKAVVVATTGPDQVRVYGVEAAGLPTNSIDRRAGNMTFSRDGRTFAAVTGEGEENVSIEIWDTTAWTSRLRIPYPKPADRPAEVRALALSPDGKTLVTGGGDKTLRWWDTTTGKETRKVATDGRYFNRAAFRPDGKVLLTASHENHVRLWDVETGKELPLPAGPTWVIVAAAFTPDGKRVLTVSERTVYAHDAATGRESWRGTAHTDSAVQVVVTPDGRTAISSGHDGRIVFWEVATGRVLRTIENPRHTVDVLALSPDGQMLTALGGEAPHDAIMLRWDVRTGKAFAPAPLPAKDSRYFASSIRFAPDGSGVAIASGTELRVPVFDPIRKEVRQQFGPTDGGVSCAEYFPDGRTIAAATYGSSIMLWETATGQRRLHLKDVGYTTCLAFSPDGRFLAAANDGRHRLITGGKTIEQTQDKTVVRLLDSFTGKEVHRFAGHTGSVTRLVWSSDGRRLLSGSHDSSCLIWDVSAEIRAKLPANPVSDREARALVDALSGPDATAAYAAMAKLVASPASAVSAIREKLRPVPAPDEAKIAALVRDLDRPQFAARERAAAELGRLGDIAEGPLKKARAGPLSAEAGDRVDKLLADLQPSTGRLWQGRALDVLQRTGGPDAKRFLEELAAGADGAWLTREAKAALVRTHP